MYIMTIPTGLFTQPAYSGHTLSLKYFPALTDIALQNGLNLFLLEPPFDD